MANAKAKPTEFDDEVETLPNLRFDQPWKASFTLLKVATVRTTGINGDDFAYPLLTVGVVDPGTAPGVAVGDVVQIHGFPTTLISELKRVKPQVNGEPLTIHYQGKRTTKANRIVRVFALDSDDTAPADWDDCPF